MHYPANKNDRCIMKWLDRLIMGQTMIWREDPLPGPGQALALAPHPDDPEAIAVTLRLLALGGWTANFKNEP
jgi:hypothetical protein